MKLHAFIWSRLGYCNALCSTLNQLTFSWLQLYYLLHIKHYGDYYLADLFRPYETFRCLRYCMYCGLFQDPDIKGDRAIAVEAPMLWNSLPVDIRFAESVSVKKIK